MHAEREFARCMERRISSRRELKMAVNGVLFGCMICSVGLDASHDGKESMVVKAVDLRGAYANYEAVQLIF